MITKAIKTIRLYLRYLCDKYPVFEPLINKIWNTYEQVLFKSSIYANTRRCDELAGLDPCAIVYVSPHKIVSQSNGGFHFLKDSGRIESGNWDQVDKIIENSYRYKSFKNHFEDDLDWEKTEFYRRKLQKLGSEERIKSKYVTKNSLNKKCIELDRVYESIKNDGYKSQAQLMKQHGLSEYLGDGGTGLLPENKDTFSRHEIAVDIGRHGEPLLNEGRHRLCIAKLLDIDKVPVRIVVRHREWQYLRNKIAHFLITDCSVDAETDVLAEVEAFMHDEINVDSMMGVDHPDILNVVNKHSNTD